MVQQSSMQNQVCLVTGATAGLGKAVAVQLAQRGATVVIIARTPAKGEAAVAEIKSQAGNAAVSALVGDVSSMADVSIRTWTSTLKFPTAPARPLLIPVATRSHCLRISGWAPWKAPTPIPPIVTLFEIETKD